jgi:CRISPR system Cascade subunit CasE
VPIPPKKIRDERGRLNQKGNVKKCRVPLIQEREQKDWLERKLNTFCTIEALAANRELPLYFRKGKESRTGKIQSILFDGILRVNDPDSFLVTITRGIGPAKAFGCGLLSIAPA